jgi:hypothetical protein
MPYMPDETLLTLYQANQIRCELAAIWSDLRFKIGQLARLPTRACVSGLARWLRLTVWGALIATVALPMAL